MSTTLRALADADGVTWHWPAADGQGIEHGDAAALAARAGDAAVSVLLPAAAVGLVTIAIPARNLGQARQAAPYAIEDQVIGEVDELELALAPLGPAGEYAVAYVDRARLDGWLQPLVAAGIDLAGAWSEVLYLPPPPAGGWSVLVTAARFVVRTSTHGGFGGDLAMLDAVLSSLEDGARPALVELVMADDDVAAPAWPEDVRVQTRHDRRAARAVLAAADSARPPLDLLPARFAPRRHGDQRRTWLLVAALAVLALGVHVFALVGSVHELDGRLQILRDQQQALFRDAFPSIRRVVNPVAQARQALEQKRAEARPRGSFLDALQAVARSHASSASDAIALRNLSYGAGELALTVEAPAVAGIERFGELLADGGAFRAEIRSAESAENGVTSRLTVSPQ